MVSASRIRGPGPLSNPSEEGKQSTERRTRQDDRQEFSRCARRGRLGFPLELGTDGAGIVAAVRSNVSRFKVGEEVYSYNSDNPKGGCYAQYVAVPAERGVQHGGTPRSFTPVATATVLREGTFGRSGQCQQPPGCGAPPEAFLRAWPNPRRCTAGQAAWLTAALEHGHRHKRVPVQAIERPGARLTSRPWSGLSRRMGATSM